MSELISEGQEEERLPSDVLTGSDGVGYSCPPMYILGLTTMGEAAAALLRDGELVAACMLPSCSPCIRSSRRCGP